MSEPFDDRPARGTDRGTRPATDRPAGRHAPSGPPGGAPLAAAPGPQGKLPGGVSDGPAADSQFVYLGRQPILDRSGALNAYELLFRDSAHNHARVTDDAQA